VAGGAGSSAELTSNHLATKSRITKIATIAAAAGGRLVDQGQRHLDFGRLAAATAHLEARRWIDPHRCKKINR